MVDKNLAWAPGGFNSDKATWKDEPWQADQEQKHCKKSKQKQNLQYFGIFHRGIIGIGDLPCQQNWSYAIVWTDEQKQFTS